MKKLLVLLVSFLFVACATLPASHKLLTRYYNTHPSGQYMVTEEVFPSEDLFWIQKENTDDNGFKVPLVWTMEGSPVVGVVFDWENTEAPYDSCGVLIFNSIEGRDRFFNQFDQTGIIGGQNLPCDVFLPNLQEQIDHPKKRDVV